MKECSLLNLRCSLTAVPLTIKIAKIIRNPEVFGAYQKWLTRVKIVSENSAFFFMLLLFSQIKNYSYFLITNKTDRGTTTRAGI
jgi:hypothetical protein